MVVDDHIEPNLRVEGDVAGPGLGVHHGDPIEAIQLEVDRGPGVDPEVAQQGLVLRSADVTRVGDGARDPV